MKNISFTRIKYLWIHIATISKKSILLSGLGILSIMFMFTITTFGNVNYESSPNAIRHFTSDSSILLSLYYVIFCVTLSLSIASTFKDMQTKEKRIAFLTLPATQLEKFIAYTVWAVVIPTVLFFAAAFINDLLRLALLASAGSLRFWDTELFFSLLPHYANMLNINFQQIHFSGLPAFITCHLVGFSLYLLGACIWYKHVFLKTIASVAVIAFAWTIFSVFRIELLMSDDSWICQSVRYYDIKAFLPWGNYVFIAVNGLLIMALWYVSYRLYCRREVISQKTNWFNWLGK